MNKLSIHCTDSSKLAFAQNTAHQLGAKLSETFDPKTSAQSSPFFDYALVFGLEGIALYHLKNSKIKPITVDLHQGSAHHRRQYGGGKGQLIAKAVGIQGTYRPTVFDATAGLGGDAFVLASLGCRLTLQERSAIAYALLADGLNRAQLYAAENNDQTLHEIISRMHLRDGDSRTKIPEGSDVIYLDPMFPERKKSAAVGKEMQAFHQLIGSDTDADELLATAHAANPKRIVVKRPRIAPFLADQAPNYSLEGKSSRFDIYALKKLAP